VPTHSAGGLRAAYWHGQAEPLLAIAPDSFIGLEMPSSAMGEMTLHSSP
jgi:hypothetical protein